MINIELFVLAVAHILNGLDLLYSFHLRRVDPTIGPFIFLSFVLEHIKRTPTHAHNNVYNNILFHHQYAF